MTNNSETTILLTGGAGFVGRVLCRELAKSFPCSRRVLITRKPNVDVPGWETAVAEISDFGAVRDAVSRVKPDVVLHLAAQASVADAQSLEEQTWRTNLMGTVALASAVSQVVPSALFLFVSSGEVYGASLRSGCVSEVVPPQPQNPYSLSKLSAERVLSDVLNPDNKLIIARPFNHTGSGQDRRFVLPSFASQIVEAEVGLRERAIHVGNLEAKRDFLHVHDVVAAYVGLLKAARNLNQRTVVNVCSGEAIPISHYLDIMLTLARCKIDIVFDEEKMRPSDVSCSCGDNTLLRSLVNWSPTAAPQDLCKELLSFWRSQND